MMHACILIQVVQETKKKKKKNGIEILVGQAAFKLWIKTVKIIY